MYKLSHFTETNQEVIVAFMKAHPFATLMGCAENIPVATQIPLLISSTENKITVRGHFMRHTDHHKAFEKNSEALFLFQGPQCYVSASWYDERRHGSTWNYMTVQAHAKLEFYNDEQTIDFLRDLTHRFEDEQSKPELLEDMTTEYLQANVKAIIGFEAVLRNVQATFKLSQNRNDESYKSIVIALETINKPQEQMIAAEMKKRRSNLF